jgi:Alternative complex III, ActD subunit
MPLYGLMAEFADAADLLHAAQKTRAAGYHRLDAFSPFAIEGMDDALSLHSSKISYFVLGGALVGMIAGFGMQYFSAVINYPVNVGGRPFDSIPAFIPITFEMAVLFGAFSGLIAMLVLNGLPMPYHPVFNVPEFKEMTRGRFFLCIEGRDPQFDLDATRQFLQGLNPLKVSDVEA